MAWRSSPSRHARPSGRGALKAAYADLQHELGEVRRHGYADSLEIARLTALVDALTAQTSRLHGELSSVRRELQDARTAPPRRDPYVEVLAVEAAELRSVVAAQQLVLVELTDRIGLLLDREAARAAADAAAAEAAARAADAAAAAAAAEPTPTAAPEQDDHLDDGHVVHLTDVRPFAAETPSFVDDDLDDLALLRLRMIRQTLTADAEPAAAAPVRSS
ncbi:MAG: hypothetical protein U0S36_06830 [Candidatus Nanopelagicales bacterium]